MKQYHWQATVLVTEYGVGLAERTGLPSFPATTPRTRRGNIKPYKETFMATWHDN